LDVTAARKVQWNAPVDNINEPFSSLTRENKFDSEIYIDCSRNIMYLGYI
jgi:hypothetical protein